MSRPQELQLVFRESTPGKKGEQVISVSPGAWVSIGRSADCDYTRKFVNGAVSRVHLTLSKNDDGSWFAIDGTTDKPSENGIFNKAGQRLTTHDASGKFTQPIKLCEPGDVLYLVPTNDKKEQAYLQVIDPTAPTDSNPTFRIEQQIADNHAAIKTVETLNKAQSKQLEQITEWTQGAKEIVGFAVWVSDYGKQIAKAVMICVPVLLLGEMFWYLHFDHGTKQIFDWAFPPAKVEQKK